MELLPTAYVFLKAVLEYPKWAAEHSLGEKLVKDVERWGKWVIERLKEDPDIRELYDEDVAVYIGTWEIRCPHCGRWTPLVGNWWLARVPKEASEEEEGEEGTKSGTFKRLAWMEPVKAGNHIAIKIVDLNKELRKKILNAKVNTSQGIIIAEGRKYTVPRKNIEAKRQGRTTIMVGICLHCNNKIDYEPNTKEEYVKKAIQDWNQKLEQYLQGQIDLQTLKETVKARPRLLVKVRTENGDLEFQPATQEDQEKLWKALQKLRHLWGDPDIPSEPIPDYESRRITPIIGAKYWYQFFSPRQLLALVKLVKLIREVGKKIEEEKLQEGWSKEEAYKYAEVIITYLAIALIKLVDYNSIVTRWKPDSWVLNKAQSSLSFRGIAMVWNWVETSPTSNIQYSFGNSIRTLQEALLYLVSTVSGSSSRVRVLLDDATVLGKLGNEGFNVIVTDPPYRDDVPYAELSDFYYVWLKRALSDVVDVGGLAVRHPRFLAEAFFENGVEIETQWKYFADKEVSEDESRSKFFGGDVGSLEYFKRLLTKSF